MASISDILMAQGRHAAESRRTRAGTWTPLVQHLASLPGQVMADRQADRAGQEAAFDRQQQRAVRGQQLAKGEQELETAEATAEQKRQMNDLLATPGVIGDDGRFDVQRAQRTATEKGYKDVLDDVLTFSKEWNDGVDKGLLTKEQIEAAKRSNQPKPAEPFTLSPGQQRFNPDGMPMASVPAEEKPDTRALNVQLADAMKNGRMSEASAIRRAIREAAVAGHIPAQGNSNNDPGPLETIIGPDGKPIRVKRSDAIGKSPASGTEKASSGVQKRVLNFFNRAEQADKDLEALEPEIEKQNLSGQAWQAFAPNFAQTQLGQSYTAAQRAFTEARLRKDSGAAIPDHEFKSDRQTYFVQPGDSKKTIQDKNRARAAMLASLAFESGQALGEFLGDSEEARSTVDRYKARASAKATATAPTAPAGWKYVPKPGGGWTAVEDN